MRWSTFFQIVLLIVISAVVLSFVSPHNHKSTMKNRYQFFPEISENAEFNIPGKGIVYVPTTYSADFDKWTGKICRSVELVKPPAMMEVDYINKTLKVSSFSAELTNINYDFDVIEKRAAALLEQQDRKNKLETLKVLK